MCKSIIIFFAVLGIFSPLFSKEIVHLKFDSNLKDSSGKYHGKFLGGTVSYTTDRFGNPGKAVVLKKGSRISLGNADLFSLLKNGKLHPFTVEWFQCYDENGDGKGVGILQKNGEYRIIWNNIFRFRAEDTVRKSPLSRCSSSVALKHGMWTHIAVVFENSNTIRFYQDGEEVAVVKDKVDNGKFQTVTAGKSPVIIGANFEGALDDFIIHDHALSGEEIRKRVPVEKDDSPDVKGAFLHLKFNGNLKDSVGTNHGEAKGEIISYTSDRFGNPGRAVVLKKGSRIVLENSPELSLVRDGRQSSFTIEWFQRYDEKAKGQGVGILHKKGEYQIMWNNKFRFRADDSVNKTALSRNGATLLRFGKWTHIAVVFENGGSNGVKFYQDGELVNIQLDPVDKGLFRSMNVSDSPLIIGINFEGALDDFIIYDRALSGEEIRRRSVSQVTADAGTVILDGKLDDLCWKNAVPITAFCRTIGTAPIRGIKTFAYLTYDDEAIYVAFRCKSSAAISADESVEVFLAPIPSHGSGCKITVKADGDVAACHFLDPEMTIKVNAAVSCNKNEWISEIKIPYSELDLPLVTGKEWGINLVRNEANNKEKFIWSSAFIRYDLPENFGKMICSKAPDIRKFQQIAVTERFQKMKDAVVALPRADQAELTTEITALSRIGDAETLIAQITALENKIQERLIKNSIFIDGKLQVQIGNSLQKIFSDRPSSGFMPGKSVQLSVAANEAESFQLVVSGKDGKSLQDVSVSGLELKNGSSVMTLSYHKVGFIRTLEHPVGYQNAPAGLYPDPLLPAGKFNVSENCSQPLWFTIQVPEKTVPGIYQGKITISSENNRIEVPISVRVRPFILPRTLASAFGNYNIASTNYYKQPMPLEKFVAFCHLMNQYRMGSKSAVREKIHTVGDNFDFSSVKQLLPEVFPYDAGIYRAGLRCRALEDEVQFNNAVDFYKKLTAAWLTEKLPETMFMYGLDEPAIGGKIGFSSPDKVALLPEFYKKLKEIAPYPVMQTLNNFDMLDELVGSVDIWCPLLTTYAAKPDFFQTRKAKKETLWLYTCNGDYPPTPNFYIERPGIEHRIIFWQAYREGATGFLYWEVNWWRVLESDWLTNPVIKSDRSRNHGDGILFYPGPDFEVYPSIRAAMIRDGIEDYEYLVLLKKLTAELKQIDNGSHRKLIAEAERLGNMDEITTDINHYTRSPEKIFERREKIGDTIEKILIALNR